MRAQLSFVLSQITRLPDRQTDRHNSHRYTVQRGKNVTSCLSPRKRSFLDVRFCRTLYNFVMRSINNAYLCRISTNNTVRLLAAVQPINYSDNGA